MQALVRARGIAYNAIALAVGIGAGLVLVAAIGADLGTASSALLLAPISDPFNFSEVFVRFTPLLIMGLGIGMGLRANAWNVGAEGQFIVGSVFAVAAAVYLTSVPPVVRVFLMVAAGAGGGLLWIVVPALLKARFGANEIIVTLLLNVVAASFLLYALDGPIRGVGSAGYLISDRLPLDLTIPRIFPGSSMRVNYGILVGVSLAFVFYLFMERTAFGVQIRAVGKSVDVARYAGIDIRRVFIVTLLISGATAGLAGALHVMGVIYTLDPGYPSGFGFIAIIVAMLGGTNVLGIGASALVFSYVVVGAENLQRAAQVPFFVVVAIEGLVLISLAVSQYLTTKKVI